ncbi:MAG TPA: exodeoxyribonuclease VII large subunit [Gemmatimonadaceae bacterium]|nr:exodeoxyribonuclease VII large subunit [Gemmatimonadaceae bacterium]
MRRRREPPTAHDHDLDLFGDPPPPSAQARAEPGRLAESSAIYEELGTAFPGASPSSAVSVSTVTQTARDILEGAFLPLWVRGEVIDFKAHRNGHWYFCLRDGSSQLRCVVWSRDRRSIPAPPDDGMQVTVLGQLTVYAARGDMQFSVRRIEAEGDGLWRKALERTRAKLEADGLLARERKRPLPKYPRVVAIVTSPDGAALHDVVAVVRRRAPQVRLVLVPATVQGDAAPEELCYAIDQVSRWNRADTVIIGRGGGAREDLRAFNDERVARALARCPAPTISAVGHEIDVTICDLVADHRAPTPSAAAEAAVRSTEELLGDLQARGNQLLSAVAARIDGEGVALHRLAGDLTTASQAAIDRRGSRISAVAGRLHALSPVATLARGYAIAQSDDGKTLASVEAFTPDMEFDLRLNDGTVRSTANSIQKVDPSSRRLPSSEAKDSSG